MTVRRGTCGREAGPWRLERLPLGDACNGCISGKLTVLRLIGYPLVHLGTDIVLQPQSTATDIVCKPRAVAVRSFQKSVLYR